MQNKYYKIIVIILLLLSGLSGFVLSWYQYYSNHRLKQHSEIDRIETFHSPALLVKQLDGDPQAGGKIFKEFCAACHSQDPSIDIHAPRIGDKKAWSSRRKLGLPVLLQVTIRGVGAMPARGGCFECSDEQLKEVIEYMLYESE